MGCCVTTSVFRPIEGVPGQDKLANSFYQDFIELEPIEIDRIYVAFTDIDANSSGFIRRDEFRSYFFILNNGFTECLLGMYGSVKKSTDISNPKLGYLTFFDFITIVSSLFKELFCRKLLIFSFFRKFSFGYFYPQMWLIFRGT